MKFLAARVTVSASGENLFLSVADFEGDKFILRAK